MTAVPFAGSARRLQGDRYVSGTIRYLDDVRPEGCLHLAFLRSPHAHAKIIGIRCDAARALPGVHAALGGEDLAGAIGDLVTLIPNVLSGTESVLTLPCLPTERVRFVGEPVALVVADTELAARRAAAAIVVDYEVLTPLMDIPAALADGAPLQHPALKSNVVMAGVVTEGDSRAALSGAAHVLEGSVVIGRSSAVPLEPRGCIAYVDEDTQRLVVRAAVQQPHGFRADLARQLGMPESDIQVVTPPLGGAFGFKFIGFPEEPLACLMARKLARPVRWVESRNEALLVGAREYAARWNVGFDEQGRVLGLSVDLEANVGALCATPGPLMPIVAASTFPGPYDIPHLDVRWRVVMSNKGPWNGARGYGKEAACLVLENALDAIAHHLGIDPVAVRRENLLRLEQFPHRTRTMTVDSGKYREALDRVLAISNYEKTRKELATQPRGRTRRGIGLGFELTPEGYDGAGSLVRGVETSTVRIDTSGYVTVLTGVTSPGTGSETAIAQLVASQLGISAEHVRVVQGDTDTTPYGAGSFSSRAAMVGGTAAFLAAKELRASLCVAAAALLGAEAEQIVVNGGLYHVRDAPSRGMPFAVLVGLFRSLGKAVAGVPNPQLEATCTYGPDNIQSVPDATGRLQLYPTYAYSIHVAEVEVDLETGVTKLTAMSCVHDCGTVINLALVDAQLHGAVTMGVGLALTEEERYDAAGQPQSLGFKRYLLPRVKDLPAFRTDHVESPSPFTVLGTKGAGESGVGGSAAAIAAAVRDAIGEAANQPLVLPLTPPRVLARIDRTKGGFS